MPDYTKQTWADGVAGATPISAARLNHMEDGIDAASVPDGTYGRTDGTSGIWDPTHPTYGAEGDGATDDLDALEGLFDASPEVVDFPAGTFRITGPLDISTYASTLSGRGREKTEILCDGALAAVIINARNVKLKGLSFRGTNGCVNPLVVTNGRGLRASDVLVSDGAGDGVLVDQNYGAYAGGSNNHLRWFNCQFRGNGGSGYARADGTINGNNHEFYGCDSNANAEHGGLIRGAGHKLVGGDWSGNGGWGVKFAAPGDVSETSSCYVWLVNFDAGENVLGDVSTADAEANGGRIYVIGNSQQALVGDSSKSAVTAYVAKSGAATEARGFNGQTFKARGLRSLGLSGQPAVLAVEGRAGQRRSLTLRTDSSGNGDGRDRWRVEASTTAEAGASAGSDFAVVSCDDNGDALFTVMEIIRSSGLTTLNKGLVVKGTHVSLDNAIDIAVGTGTGSKIGRSATQKLGFWGATPVVRPTLPAAGVVTADDIRALLVALGLAA